MSIFRNIVWFLKGLKEYTKSGYQTAAKSFKPQDLDGVDASGKSYMITGANSGVGKVTALTLAKHGGTVHLVCRNSARGEEARTDIIKATNNENVHLHIVDLSAPAEVETFAQTFVETVGKLDVLVNNAGCMEHERKIDRFGLESNFATNVLAPYLLTETLIPLLIASPQPRVINVSSGGMLTQKLDLSDMQSRSVQLFDATLVYAQHKRQMVVMTEQYAKKYPKVHFSSMHPGWVDTPAVSTAMPDFHSRMKDRLRTPEQGADTIIWLALSSAALRHGSGDFFQDRQPVPKHLPLAWTRSSSGDDELLLLALEELVQTVHSKRNLM